ncbi:hypothetical protein ACGFNQ_02500 [Streptomyces asoensis]|uniref:hypothetical protein n=1 Tax=Streptomyces asoensis TaxID=249586 RepID=UPI0037101B6E
MHHVPRAEVADLIEELDRVQRRDERIMLGFSVFAWSVGSGCYAGVAYAALHGDGPLTTGFGIFGTLICGWGYTVFTSYRKRRARRRGRWRA